MSEAQAKGLRQKAFRQRQKEKQEATKRELEELSERVAALELERDQLQKAVETATSSSDPQGSGSPCKGKACSDDDEVAVILTFGEATPQLQLSRSDMRTLTVEAMASVWKTLMQKMALYLSKVEGPAADARFWPRLEDSVAEAVVFMWALVDYNPPMISALTTCNVENPTVPQCPENCRDWQTILARMELTKSQIEELLSGRRVLLRELGALIAERERLWAELQTIKDVEEREEGAMINYACVADITERLRHNVHSLHTCRAYYLSHIYNKVLLPVQVAHYLVGAYPMGPDTLSLMTCLAEQQRNQPSTDELLRTARPPPNASPSFFAVGDWREALLWPLRVLHRRVSWFS